MEIGEEKTLGLASSEAPLRDTVLEYLSLLMAGEDFIYLMDAGAYAFTWNLPHMTHRIEHTSAFDVAHGQKLHLILKGETKWGKLSIRRTQ